MFGEVLSVLVRISLGSDTRQGCLGTLRVINIHKYQLSRFFGGGLHPQPGLPWIISQHSPFTCFLTSAKIERE